MHTLKEILTEPQTMYDGGVVGMADGGLPEDQKKVLEARQKIEQIEVPEEPTPTGTAVVEGAKKLAKGVAKKAIPFVNVLDAKPVADATLPGFEFEDALINQAIKNSDFYHGTIATELKGGKFKASKEGVLGTGVYVTPDPDYAASYSKGQGGNIHAVKVNIETPLIVRIKGSFSDYAPARVLEELGVETKKAFDLAEKWSEELGGDVTTQFKSRAVKQGYDSIVLVNDETNIIQEIVAFNPDQIVSKFKSMYDGGIVNMQDGGKPQNKIPVPKVLKTALELGVKKHPVSMIVRALTNRMSEKEIGNIIKILKDTPAHKLFGLKQSGSQSLQKLVNDFKEGFQTQRHLQNVERLQRVDKRRIIRTELPKAKLMYDGGLV